MDDRERIARLERAAGLLTAACVVLGAGLALAALFIAAPWSTASPPGAASREVRTRRLVLVDEGGRERAALANRPGATLLGFFDERGRPRLSLMLLDDGSARLSAFDEEGRPVPMAAGR